MMTRLVIDYLDVSAEKFPNKVAFIDTKRSVTFNCLQQESYRIATGIIHKKLLKKPIVILLDKSVACIAAFIGTVYSGNFYTPLDTKIPIDRMNKILGTLKPEVLITDEVHCDLAKRLNFSGELLLYEELMQIAVEKESIAQIKENIIDTDILYILFTSGSTGNPKGVVICHRSVIDYIDWVAKTFDINEKTILGNQAPLYFDLSIQDVYCTLKAACTTYLIAPSKFIFPVELMRYIAEKNINTIFWVPSALCLIANLKVLKKKYSTKLKKILFCGEVMPNKQLNMWRDAYPNALFVNLYGPTEITEVCTYYVVDRKFNDDEVLPIGKPCQNTDIFVLNEINQLVKDNEIGELCVRGTSLAYGYYNDPQKTAEVFVQNPLNPYYPEIIYRTGDLVRYNEYGELMYLSRKDFQIKHMGYRIELGEIETAVSAIEGINSNCCLYDEKKSKIVMFYTGEVDEYVVLEKVEMMLPKYMLPDKRIHLEAMPLNLNGKIDRVQLKNML